MEAEGPRPGGPHNFLQSSSAQAFPSFCSRTFLILMASCLSCYQRKSKGYSFLNVFKPLHFNADFLQPAQHVPPQIVSYSINIFDIGGTLGRNIPKYTSEYTMCDCFFRDHEARNRVLAALGRNQACRHLDLGLLRPYISVV